ncbi:hypothetical protein RFI_13908 [Reticulomyxa filosa]|uniref:Uncharacterized protein n=1 Tax=Reticulomyxa filosa TaxID=46433 RepID=X6NAF0_RETFI|nr:hypothetical protein RFI_13908 [Reticulomyxa filosa]|eukprot:ETO23275.1 hypothetical protein RFI_13908 [Reticulomyxa filosa]
MYHNYRELSQNKNANEGDIIRALLLGDNDIDIASRVIEKIEFNRAHSRSQSSISLSDIKVEEALLFGEEKYEHEVVLLPSPNKASGAVNFKESFDEEKLAHLDVKYDDDEKYQKESPLNDTLSAEPVQSPHEVLSRVKSTAVIREDSLKVKKKYLDEEESTRFFTAQIALSVINDVVNTSAMPFFSIKSTEIKLAVKQYDAGIDGNLDMVLMSNYYNPIVVTMEPLLERTKLAVKLDSLLSLQSRGRNSNYTARVLLQGLPASDDEKEPGTVNFNVTHIFLKTAMDTLYALPRFASTSKLVCLFLLIVLIFILTK